MFATEVVTVPSTTPVLIYSTPPGVETEIMVYNRSGGGSIFLGDSAVTTTTGYPLSNPFTLHKFIGEIYAMNAGASANVGYTVGDIQ